MSGKGLAIKFGVNFKPLIPAFLTYKFNGFVCIRKKLTLIQWSNSIRSIQFKHIKHKMGCVCARAVGGWILMIHSISTQWAPHVVPLKFLQARCTYLDIGLCVCLISDFLTIKMVSIIGENFHILSDNSVLIWKSFRIKFQKKVKKYFFFIENHGAGHDF